MVFYAKNIECNLNDLSYLDFLSHNAPNLKFEFDTNINDLQGALQDVRVVEGAAGHLLQCPQAEAQCPTCGGFQQLAEQVAMLQDLVAQLTQKVKKRGESF